MRGTMPQSFVVSNKTMSKGIVNIISYIHQIQKLSY
jgi:hypothetical protein